MSHALYARHSTLKLQAHGQSVFTCCSNAQTGLITIVHGLLTHTTFSHQVGMSSQAQTVHQMSSGLNILWGSQHMSASARKVVANGVCDVTGEGSEGMTLVSIGDKGRAQLNRAQPDMFAFAFQDTYKVGVTFAQVSLQFQCISGSVVQILMVDVFSVVRYQLWVVNDAHARSLAQWLAVKHSGPGI